MNTQVREIVSELGGREEAAKLCSVTIDAVKKWDQNGIPTKHWPTLIEQCGIPLERLMAVKPFRKAS